MERNALSWLTFLFVNLIQDYATDSPKVHLILHASIQDTSHFLPVQVETCSVLRTWCTTWDNHTSTSWLEQVPGQNWVVTIFLCELNEPRAEQGSWMAARQRQVDTGEVEPLACSAQTHRSPRSSRSKSQRKVQSLINLFAKPIPNIVD